MGDWNYNPRRVVDKRPTCVENGECRPRHRGHKNTRDWCKGRVGVPHAWERQERRWTLDLQQRYGIVINRVSEEQVCFGCGKVGGRLPAYCRRCGERWPSQWFGLNDREPGCPRCGAPARERR